MNGLSVAAEPPSSDDAFPDEPPATDDDRRPEGREEIPF